MKKYKLIKEYPGSPELNSVFEYWTDGISEQIYNGKKFVPLKIVKDYPEFWEEIVEKDYEILSFIATKKHGKEEFILTVEEIGKIKTNSNVPHYFELQRYLDNESGFWNIYSVKRLSDGEIFTIGNKCTLDVKITGFEVVDSKIKVLSTIVGDWQWLNSIQHIKKPLFTTEDGVDIFEGDKCFAGYLHRGIKNFILDKWDGNGKNMLYFSTKKAAEEYILMNKPCLSINDVMSIPGYPLNILKVLNTLKKLVKSKL